MQTGSKCPDTKDTAKDHSLWSGVSSQELLCESNLRKHTQGPALGRPPKPQHAGWHPTVLTRAELWKQESHQPWERPKSSNQLLSVGLSLRITHIALPRRFLIPHYHSTQGLARPRTDLTCGARASLT